MDVAYWRRQLGEAHATGGHPNVVAYCQGNLDRVIAEPIDPITDPRRRWDHRFVPS